MIDKYLKVRKLTKPPLKRSFSAKLKGSVPSAQIYHVIRLSGGKPSPSLPSRRTISEVLR